MKTQENSPTFDSKTNLGRAMIEDRSTPEPHSPGTTESERYLSHLCRRSFLSLWSYSNPYTDEGRRKGRGAGNELCDLLVVFGDDVVIFSDKRINFNRNIDTPTAWSRWFKKAVLKSAAQIFGAELWLRTYPERIFRDKYCEDRLPAALPVAKKIRIHRVAVALGAYDACREHFGRGSLGSLMVDSAVEGSQHFDRPFTVGHVNRQKGFVHVLDDLTLNVALQELDTAADFITYLKKRESFLSKQGPVVIASGDEQLLALYMTTLNEQNEHDFVLPAGGLDGIFLDESFFQGMISNPQYVAKKRENHKSYIWDRLIEHLIKHANILPSEDFPPEERSIELPLRHMASESRIRRRQIGHALSDFIETSPNGKRATRLFFSNDEPERIYVFLITPRLPGESEDEYRRHRRAWLIANCKVAKIKFRPCSFVIGIALNSRSESAKNEDLVFLDVREWTQEMEDEGIYLQQEAIIFQDKNIRRSESNTPEWPVVKTRPEPIAMNRKQRRAAASKARRR